MRSDTDRIYVRRKEGGRDLLSLQNARCCRIIRLQERLEEPRNRNQEMNRVYNHEEQNIIRISRQLKELHTEITGRIYSEYDTENLGDNFKKILNVYYLVKWREKPMHG